MYKTLVVIPARMASTRLPGKPLADIHGSPMIVHVWRRAMAAQMGRVVVATDSEDIAQAVRAVGGEAVMTRDDHVSGSDRIFEALSRVDPEEEVDFVINLQGDLPTLDPVLMHACLEPLLDQAPQVRSVHNRSAREVQAHIATLAAQITSDDERTNPNVVKLIGTPVYVAGDSAYGGAGKLIGLATNKVRAGTNGKTNPSRLRALYFTRATAPHGDGPLYHHIGIYAYHRSALERFVSLSASPLEQREKLEQLRALEHGMRIDVALVDTIPLGVDTPKDLEKARALITPDGNGVT